MMLLRFSIFRIQVLFGPAVCYVLVKALYEIKQCRNSVHTVCILYT